MGWRGVNIVRVFKEGSNMFLSIEGGGGLNCDLYTNQMDELLYTIAENIPANNILTNDETIIANYYANVNWEALVR